jgi:inhibitor of cysteine peptidase
MVRPRRWLFVLAGVVLIGLAGLLVVRGVQRARYGEVHDEASTTITVDRGGRFSLTVPDRGASIGDWWTAEIQPAGGVILARSELIYANLVDRLVGPATGGGRGTRVFVFDARRSGSVTITLHNCYRGCDNESTRAESRDAVWTVRVR